MPIFAARPSSCTALGSNKNHRDTKKTRTTMRWWRRLFAALVLLVLLVVAVLLGAEWYLESQKEKVLDRLSFVNNGTLKFSRANVSLLRNFPLLSIDVYDVYAADSLVNEHGHPILEIGRLELVASLAQLRQRNIQLQRVSLKNAHIDLWTDTSGYNNLKSFLIPPAKTLPRLLHNPLRRLKNSTFQPC